MPLAGQVVGEGVRLVRPLGRGSHSVVYFAVDAEGQPRAVKIFEPHFAAHAERELAHGAGLDHPRLVQVLAPVTVEGRPALLLTYARGQVLFTRYAHRPALTFDRRAYLLTLAHLLGALGHLHERSVVHRDVKPENIIAEPDGSATLLDFDLSGPAGETFAAPTRMGTAAFQSPESRRGEPLGPESDLYGVGILLGWGLHGALGPQGVPPPPAADPLDPLLAALTEPDRSRRLGDAAEAREWLLRLAGLPY
ncbi:serine/threonine protein kinase [Deinococcus sp. SDU3-2]|uniref:Serine/threonine protein kinase n=1 Tax=Deinococcus terrestris TaxID=2651870 RepID=A0A7X1TQY0_9DEIO|nr:serine/threonine-protein kinase [Deinococcus terrestris]MPY65799.1 serine/threonine protein kinase [Deinococcus terrestris]